MSKVYIYFLNAVTSNFDRFNLLLQSQQPKIHELHPAAMKLYREILSYLVKPEVMQRYLENILDLPFEDADMQRSDRDRFIGNNASETITECDIEGSSEVKAFRQEVRLFYIGALQYTQKSFHSRIHC